MSRKQNWRRDEPDSPCVNICLIHPQAEICVGCFRTGDEIANWASMGADQRRALMQELPNRADQVAPKRRGRAKRIAQGQSAQRPPDLS